MRTKTYTLAAGTGYVYVTDFINGYVPVIAICGNFAGKYCSGIAYQETGTSTTCIFFLQSEVSVSTEISFIEVWVKDVLN